MTSGYLDGSEASRRVSEKLGYTVSGYETVSVLGRRRTEFRVSISRETWLKRDPAPITVRGLSFEALAMCGARTPQLT